MRILSIIFLTGLLLALPSYADQVKLLSVNDGVNSKNQVALEFTLSNKTTYKTFFLPNPQRFVVDFDRTTLSEGVKLSANKPQYINAVRSARLGEDGLRVVFDFKQEITLNSETVKSEFLDNSHLILSFNVGSVLDTVLSASTIKSDVAEPSSFSALEKKVALNKTQKISSNTIKKDFFSDWEFSGKVSFEELGFFQQSLSPKQHQNYISGAIEPEIYREWDDGKQSFTFSPFFRYSQYDNRRTHFDIRELTWLLAEDDWELRVGFRKVFWGVAEGLHLVDIINQTDLIENTDTEDKLGQPMINLALIREWGTLDLFVLPGFRERTFPGQEGRLRTIPEVSVGDAEFEHYGFEKHMAYAIRWSHAIGDWDVGLSHFYGTSREPVFKPLISPAGSVSLIPYYDLINQTGLDLQLTYEDWIFKHEGIVRSGQGNAFYAMTTGVEYTLFDLFSTGLDLGLVVEYMYDTRGENNFLAPFQDDILTAVRFGFNDIQSTEILAGVLFDRTNNTKFYNIEASRRFGDSFKVDIEFRLFSDAPANDPSFIFRDDDHVRMEISYHY